MACFVYIFNLNLGSAGVELVVGVGGGGRGAAVVHGGHGEGVWSRLTAGVLEACVGGCDVVLIVAREPEDTVDSPKEDCFNRLNNELSTQICML